MALSWFPAATWFCRAASGLMWRPIPAGLEFRARRTGDGPGGGAGNRKNPLLGAEPLASTDVDGLAPGEAPQPLTLNHPASNPGRLGGRGSFLAPV